MFWRGGSLHGCVWGHAMFAGGISGFPLFGANLASAGLRRAEVCDPTSSPVRFFERICATAEQKHAAYRDQDRKKGLIRSF